MLSTLPTKYRYNSSYNFNRNNQIKAFSNPLKSFTSTQNTNTATQQKTVPSSTRPHGNDMVYHYLAPIASTKLQLAPSLLKAEKPKYVKEKLYELARKKSHTLSNPAIQVLTSGDKGVTEHLSVKDHKHYIDGSLRKDVPDPKKDPVLQALTKQAKKEMSQNNVQKKTIEGIEKRLDKYFVWPNVEKGIDDQIKVPLDLPKVNFKKITDKINSPKSGEYLKAANHIHENWQNLYRKTPKKSDSTLIPLPKPYVIPGGRFREMYYWDSYFTMLGLKKSKLNNVAKDMTENFMYMVNKFGFIPNGNRVYYFSRSQPPFLAMMVDETKPKDLSKPENKKWMENAYKTVSKEYKYNWMDPKTHYVPKYGLNRYYDVKDEKRPEAFAEDNANVKITKGFFKNERAEAESGWDFSPRFDQRCTDYLPVDLNCILYKNEKLLGKWAKDLDKPVEAIKWNKRAEKRKNNIMKLLYNKKDGMFYDYDMKNKKQSDYKSIAAVFPMWAGIVPNEPSKGDENPAKKLKDNIIKEFECKGGIAASSKNNKTEKKAGGKDDSEYQWAHPNGWAPHQLVTVEALKKYGFDKDAKRIAKKWVDLNTDEYNKEHKFFEKYNVKNASTDVKTSYPQQDGFGWTNGVYLTLLDEVLADNKKSDQQSNQNAKINNNNLVKSEAL